MAPSKGMDPARWQEIERLYHAAHERPVPDRAAFLAQTCAGDPALRHEVELLLAQAASADGFLEAGALAAAGRTGGPSVLTGRRLGVYEVQEQIGAGGMGEVYRARDTKLGRDVAIKILPRAFSANADRLARFEREARLLATLNHPNIATIHGVEDSDGVRALIMELVAGETLADRLRRGPLPISDALPVAVQIAEALEAAHEKGIVHRDLKPANIKITPAGVVKVLDFGLAKVAAGDGAGSQAPTVTTDGTHEGVILGTAAYMSPEQARGQAVDKRADIWAFGCVLCEMLAGRSLFGRETVAETLAAVLEREPDWSSLPAVTPQGLRRLLLHCLEKNPKQRFHDIADVRIELEDLRGPLSSVTGESSSSNTRPSSRLWPVIMAAAGAAVLFTWLVQDSQTTSETTVPVSPTLERLTYDSGLTRMPALSPDGRLLAYASDRSGRGDLDVWVQQTGGGSSLRLTDDPADDTDPEFSPDGRQIVFRSDREGGGVYVVPALGGAARLIAPGGRGARFSPDGSHIAYWAGQFRTAAVLESGVFTIALSGGTPTRLLPEFAGARDPTWSPDGQSLLVLGRRERDSPMIDTDWWWVPLDGGSAVKTGVLDLPNLRSTGASPDAWISAGVVFSDGRNLQLIQMSDAGRPGRVQPLTSGTGAYTDAAMTPAGELVFAALAQERVIEMAGLGSHDPRPLRLLGDGQPQAWRASATRNGDIFAFERQIGDESEIWTRNVRTGQQQSILRIKAPTPTSATISQDGARIAYTVRGSTANTGQGVVVETAGGVPRTICEDCALYGFLADNRRVLAEVADGHALRVYDVTTGAYQDLVTTTEGRLNRPHASHDDRWLAFRQIIGTSGKTFVVRMPAQPVSIERAEKIDEPTTTGRPAAWSLEAPIVYLLLDTDGFRCLWAQRVDAASGRLVGKPYLVRHFHGQQVATSGGVSTSYGNAVTTGGFIYETMAVTGDIWRLKLPPAK